jgi:hypothetical protein
MGMWKDGLWACPTHRLRVYAAPAFAAPKTGGRTACATGVRDWLEGGKH